MQQSDKIAIRAIHIDNDLSGKRYRLSYVDKQSKQYHTVEINDKLLVSKEVLLEYLSFTYGFNKIDIDIPFFIENKLDSLKG